MWTLLEDSALVLKNTPRINDDLYKLNSSIKDLYLAIPVYCSRSISVVYLVRKSVLESKHYYTDCFNLFFFSTHSMIESVI